eukprot:gene49022-65721_t
MNPAIVQSMPDTHRTQGISMTAPLARGPSALRRQLMLTAACGLLGSAAFAQAPATSVTGDFPNKPIRMVVTFPPGGS